MLPEIQVQCRSSHWATWCSDPMRGWLYNWARDCSATTLGLSETHAINGHCTCTVLYRLHYTLYRWPLWTQLTLLLAIPTRVIHIIYISLEICIH
jgi:hypothetical protein